MMGTNIGTVTAHIGMDTRNLEAGARRSEQVVGSMSAGMRRTLTGLAGAFGVALGGAAIVSAIKSTVEASARQEEALRKLRSVVEIVGESWEAQQPRIMDFVASLQKTTRFADDDLAPSLQMITQLTGSLEKGFEGTRMAADLASSGLFDLSTASKYISMAMEGEVTMLGRYIPQLKSSYGLINENMTATQKWAIAKDLLNKKFGGMAEKDLSTFSGMLQSLKNYLGDVQERIGDVIAAKLTPKLGEWRDAVIQFIESGDLEKWADRAEKALDRVIGAGSKTVKLLGEMADGVSNLNEPWKLLPDNIDQAREKFNLAWDILKAGNPVIRLADLQVRNLKEGFGKLTEMLGLSTTSWEQWLEATGRKPAYAGAGPMPALGPTLPEKPGPAVTPLPTIDVEAIAKAAAKRREVLESIINTQVELYRGLLDQEGLSRDKLLAIWDDYEANRQIQIQIEAENLLKLGLSGDLVTASMVKELGVLGQEKEALLGSAEAMQKVASVRAEVLSGLNTEVSLYQEVLASAETSGARKVAMTEEYKAVRLDQIAAEMQALEQQNVSAQLIDELTRVRKAALYEELEAGAIRLSEVETALYGEIGNMAVNTFQNIFANGKNLADSLSDAWQLFRSSVISILANMLAKFITTSLAELARHIATEKAKTAVTAREAAKRAALEAGSGGIAGIAGFVVRLFANKGGPIGMQGGGLLSGGRSGRDSIPVMGTPGEYMMDVPTVRAIGIPAFEYMRKEHRLPGDRVQVNVNMGGFSFGQMNRIDRLTLPLELEDAVVRAVKEAIRKGKLEV